MDEWRRMDAEERLAAVPNDQKYDDLYYDLAEVAWGYDGAQRAGYQRLKARGMATAEGMA